MDESGRHNFAKVVKKNVAPYVDLVAASSRSSGLSSKMVKSFEMANAELAMKVKCTGVRVGHCAYFVCGLSLQLSL